MKFPKFSTLLSYAAVAANGVVWLSTHVESSPIPLPPWVAPVLSAAAVVAGVVLHFSQPPGALQPTPNLSVDDTGPALGKASGEAGSAAGKGPFGGAKTLLILAVACAVALAACGDNVPLSVDAPDAGAAARGSPANVTQGALSFPGDRSLVICRGTGCSGSAVRGAPQSPQQRADMLPACEPDGTGTSWGLFIDDALYCTVSRDYAHPWGVCEGYSRGVFNPHVVGCRTVVLEGVNWDPNIIIRRNIACVRDCVTGGF